jgi:hypothetical protein
LGFKSVLGTLEHVSVSVVSNGEQVRGHFGSPLALELVDDLLGVDGQTAVRVDGDTEETGVGLESRQAMLT